MFKTALFVCGGVALLFLVLPKLRSTSSSQRSAKHARDATPPVVVSKVQRKVAPLVLDAIGAAEPSRTVGVRAQITGTLMKIHFQEGQTVKQGDLLFEIDARPFQNAVSSAEADLQKIRVQLENARQQLERYESLHTNALVTKEQYQSVEAAERVLVAELASGESTLANAKLQLEYCFIRAPLSGRTGVLGVHEGDLIRASDATVSLITINELSPIYVTFSVPQQYLATLNRYLAAGPVTVMAIPPGIDEAAERGELAFIDNAVDATTGTLKLKATFPNSALRLWPGQFAAVKVALASPHALVVPSAAVQNDQKGQHVFVIKEDKVAEYRPVTVERTSDNDTVISKGLSEGEAIVIDGQLRVISGKAVEIKQAATNSPGTHSES